MGGEPIVDGTVFGIPRVGMRDVKTSELMDNNQLEPDIKIMNEPARRSEWSRSAAGGSGGAPDVHHRIALE